ncbi:TPA: alpha-amylase [Streptococcus pneumoniae]|nr:alpha-amylase [Streptococcus pneumoniae]
MQNQTLMQYFEWYLPHDGQHWTRLAENAPHLAHLGISHVWMPPAFKATNEKDVGYGVYDLFDLGEFNQKGTVRTKYGFKEDYLQAIQALKAQGIQPMADVVLNHKAAADHREAFQVIEVDPVDRTVELGEPFTINGWTSFTFDGRQDTYNDFHWHWYHFTGTDYDAKRRKSGIYLIQGDNKGWANEELVDNENGNYDYLMYADLDFKHPEVIQNIYDWADWFMETTGVAGFRLDAVKHIDSFFMRNFIRDTQRGQALESTVEEWFKPAAYALILLRQDGLPCVFYGDYYGISGQYAQEDFKEILDRLLAIRKDLAYGEQNDYFDHANCIGWVRSGAENQSPIAVLISNDQENSKSMFVGQEWTNQTFVDLLGNHQGQVTIDEEGYGQFPVSARSVSVWAVNTI